MAPPSRRGCRAAADTVEVRPRDVPVEARRRRLPPRSPAVRLCHHSQAIDDRRGQFPGHLRAGRGVVNAVPCRARGIAVRAERVGHGLETSLPDCFRGYPRASAIRSAMSDCDGAQIGTASILTARRPGLRKGSRRSRRSPRKQRVRPSSLTVSRRRSANPPAYPAREGIGQICQ